MRWLLMICFPWMTWAFDIPRMMDEADQIRTLELLGFGTSTKSISFGYPLGGYSGLEVGVNVENIPTDDLSQLGDESSETSSLTYSKFSIAKGLYKDVDIFVEFIPLNEDKGITDYGGFIRWGFYEGEFFPISVAAILHGNNINLNNLVLSESVGWNILASMFMNNFTIMAGVGRVHTTGKFIGCENPDTGCADAVTDSTESEVRDIHSLHTSIGAAYSMSKVFLAFQVDRYTDPVMSFKIGLRL